MKDFEIIQDRNQKLSKLSSEMNIKQSYPLIKEAEIKKHLYRALQDAVGAYINSCLIYNGVETDFSNYEEMIAKYRDEIFNLPNVTSPNGIIKPKLEISAEYNLIHSKVVDIIKSFGIDNQINGMRLPISIRIVDGEEPNDSKSARANNIMHSDFWTGGCCDLAFLVPLFGDIERTTVKFAEPIGMKKDFLTELPSYSMGADLYEDYKMYDMAMRKGFLYLQDIYCLHGTWREGGGPRVSMDWTVQTTNYPEIEEKYSNDALSSDNHYDVDTWNKAGKDIFYFDFESMEESKKYPKFGSNFDRDTKLGASVHHQIGQKAKFISAKNSESFLKIARRS